MTDDPRLTLTRRWLRSARGELGAGRTLVANQAVNQAFTACFHAQQAAEKVIADTILVFASVTFAKTHTLVTIQDLVPATCTLTRGLTGLETLDPYAVDTRYPVPAEDEEPTWEQASAAVALAETVVTAVTADLAGAGLTEQ